MNEWIFGGNLYWSMVAVFWMVIISVTISNRHHIMRGFENMSSVYDELRASLVEIQNVSKKKELHAKQTVGANEERMLQTIEKNFNILDRMIDKVFAGRVSALIISGAPGVGKSFPVEKKLVEHVQEGSKGTLSKGYAKATGVYEILYKNREKGSVAVFDDIDAIFKDESALNLFKVALDTTEKRKLSWLTSRVPKCTETDERLPNEFEFEGSVIFITNQDFDNMIEKGTVLAPHLEALISRSHYVDMGLRTRRHQLVRIKQIAKQGLFDRIGLTDAEQYDVLTFIETNLESLREVSLRAALKVASLRAGDNLEWEDEAKMTCCVKRKLKEQKSA